MTEKINEADRTVLRAIQKDSGASSRSLAETLGMSQSSLWRRINDLENLGAIRKRVALLDPDIVGLPVCVIVQVNMVSYEAEMRKNFEKFVSSIPEITSCYAMTGSYDYTLTVQTDSVAGFEALHMNKILAHPSVAGSSSQIALRCVKYTTELAI